MNEIHIDHDIMMNHDEKINTICQVLRETYRIAFKMGNQEIMDNCIKATIMAKKMSRKIQYYHDLYVKDGNAWHKNEGIFPRKKADEK